MPTTTQGALKDALLEKLQAREGLAGVQVSYGFPKTPQKEIVMLGDIHGRQTPGALGRLSREERYRLEVTVKVEKQGTSQQPVTQRAYALADELEAQLRSDPTVGGVVRVAQIGGEQDDPGRFQLEEFATADGQGRMAVLTIDVACQARI